MNKYVSDTMALILRLEKRKMPPKIKEIFIQGEEGKAEIIVPAMVLAEIGYLSEKKRVDTNLPETADYLNKYPAITECALNLSTVKHAFHISDIPELHDRLISAVAKRLNLPILTNDPDIEKSEFVKTIWK